MIFRDRRDAGRQLTDELKNYKDQPDTIILALPRGGVVVADEVAKKLNLPLDIVVPRKIGSPQNPEFAIGAITLQGEPVLDQRLINAYGIMEDYIAQEIAKERKEAERRRKVYRGDLPPLNLKDKTVILIDDGIATGATMMASIDSVKRQDVKRLVVAVPVIPADAVDRFKAEVDELVYLDAPYAFGAVGAFYEQFEQTSDAEVVDILKKV